MGTTLGIPSTYCIAKRDIQHLYTKYFESQKPILNMSTEQVPPYVPQDPNSLLQYLADIFYPQKEAMRSLRSMVSIYAFSSTDMRERQGR